jgi:hypothetical protein
VSRYPALRPHQRAAYQRGLAFLLEAFDILAGVKTQNWTQAVVLNEAYLKLSHAADSLAEVSPNDLAVPTRRRLSEGLG